MGRVRFVAPRTVRLDISDGDWVEIKERLNFYEREQLNQVFENDVSGGGLRVDWPRRSVKRLALWLTDWSFRDEADKPVALDEAAIKGLDPDTADEIEAAIDRYVAEQEASKKAATGEGGPTSG